MSGSTQQQQPSLNVTQDLSALPGFGTGNFPGGPANPSAYALNTLGTTEGNDINGNPISNTPYINPSYSTGLDLSTPAGLDTLGSRVSFNDPTAQFIQDTFPNSNTPSGNAAQNIYSWLSQGGPYQETTSGGQNDAALYPDPGNPNYTQGGAPGSLDLTQAGMNLAAADFGGSQATTPGPSPIELGGAFAAAILGPELIPEIGLGLGISDVAAGALYGAGTSALTSDLSGGNPLTGALEGAVTGGVGQGLSGALSGVSDTAGVADLADVSTSDLGGITAGAGSAGGVSSLGDYLSIGSTPASDLFTPPGGQSGFVDTGSSFLPDTTTGLGGGGGNFLPGPGDLGSVGDVAASPVSPGAGGLVSTADPGIDPTVFSDASGGLGQAPTGDLTLAASTSDPASSGGGFFSDLTSGNFSNLGQDVGNWFSGGASPGDLVGSDGNYILPPPQPIDPGATVVDPASGSLLAPGDAGYAQAASALQTTPQIAAPALPGGGGSWLGNLGSKFVSGLSDPFKLLGLGASGIGLGYNLIKGQQSNPIPGMSNVQSTANQLTSQGATLQNYLTSGTLPAGVQASLDQATQSAIQSVKSNFASRGIAPGSTMEQQQIAAIQQNAAAQGGQLALNLLNSGVQETDLGAQLYQSLVQTNVALNSQTEQAISNLASALAGGNHITLQTIPTTATAA